MNKNALIILVIILLVGGGAYLLLSQSKTPSTTSQPTPTQPVTTQEATPTISSQSATTTPSTKPTQTTTSIIVTANGFSPATSTIKAGTTVTWTNQSGTAVSINSDPHPTHTDYPPLNLGRLANGASISLTFDKPGTYGYHNHFNPSQKGTIIVK